MNPLKTLMKLILISLSLLLYMGCASKLVPKSLEGGISDKSRAKAIELLNESRAKQGYANIKTKTAYRFTATDKWQGFMGKMGKIWPENEAKIKLTYPAKSFDGKVEYLDGKHQGFQATLINDEYKVMDKDQKFNLAKKRNPRVIFGIEAYKFFSEITSNILTCEFLGYAGEEEFRGQRYDVIFSTWKSIEPHDEHDQYLLYINKDSKLEDRVEFTIRENYMPMPGDGMMYGNLIYQDYKEVEGYMVSHRHTIFDFDVEDDYADYLHELTIEKFEFIDIKNTPFVVKK